MNLQIHVQIVFPQAHLSDERSENWQRCEKNATAQQQVQWRWNYFSLLRILQHSDGDSEYPKNRQTTNFTSRKRDCLAKRH